MFEKQMGFRQHLLCDDRDTRHGVKSWLERVLAAYGAAPCVDIQVIAGQLILNRTTADYIYTKYTPLKLRYKPGGRRVSWHEGTGSDGGPGSPALPRGIGIGNL